MRSTILTLVAVAVTALPAAAEEGPYAKENRSWISLTGTVATTAHDTFTLDYGEGLITVEMDDWDWYSEASRLTPGERVTVYGRIDDDLYELRTIEAHSVYVKDRNTYYYANAADEELVEYEYLSPYRDAYGEGTWMTVSGEVIAIDGREFTLDTGIGKMRVDTLGMLYNPLDDVGHQQIDPGDQVLVAGNLDLDFFEKTEIQAEMITSLSPDMRTGRTSSEEEEEEDEE